MKGDSGAHMIGLLERRLDAVVFRAKFVPTAFASRQFINHGHIRVNGRRVNIPSYRVKVGDVIEVKEKSKQMALVLEAQASAERDVPDYIEVDGWQDDGQVHAHPGADRRALRGADGAASGGRISTRADHGSAALRKCKMPRRSGAIFCLFATKTQALRRARRLRPPRPFPSAAYCNSPAWNISRTMSQPPTNSPFT